MVQVLPGDWFFLGEFLSRTAPIRDFSQYDKLITIDAFNLFLIRLMTTNNDTEL